MTLARRILVLGVAMGAAGPAAGVAAQETHVLAVTGLGGAPEYAERFASWGAGLVEAALASGVAAERVVWLAEREGLHPRATGVARKATVASELVRLAQRSSAGDLVLVALFGHGSARGGEVSLNLPGPDLDAAELRAMLEPLAGRTVVVLNAASASGGWVPTLSAEGRVVITATRTAGEAEATRFGGYFVEALTDGAADTDKDGAVTVLEAFEYARLEVARSFSSAGTLPTEHALLDDDGDGRGSLEPGDADGRLAGTLALGAATASAGAGVAGASTGTNDPVLRELLAEKARLEAELQALRARQEALEPESYRQALERLLLEIARNGRSIREHQEGGEDGDG